MNKDNNKIERTEGGIITCQHIIKELEDYRNAQSLEITASIIDDCIYYVKNNKQKLKDLKIELLEDIK